MNYPIFTKEHQSLMAKYLNIGIFNHLKNLKSKNDFTLEKAINSGLKNPDSGIGVYAGDEESYTLFAALFDNIIEDYHGFKKEDKHISNLNASYLKAPLLKEHNKYILSTRIRVGRNLKNFPLGPAISDIQRKEVEKIVSNALEHLECDLKGKYYALNALNKKEQESLIKDHFLFKEGDRFLQAASLNNDWPNSRGIFHNIEKTFLVWINEEDQLRIISMQEGGDINTVFSRLLKAIHLLEEHMQFSYNEHLGYITSCPTNLGTAMRASVHIILPKLSMDMKEYKKITDKYFLQIRGIHGEHSKSEGGIYDISNKRRLGVSEVQCVQDMYDGVSALIKKEESL